MTGPLTHLLMRALALTEQHPELVAVRPHILTALRIVRRIHHDRDD